MNLEEKRHYDTSDISDIKSFGDNLLTDFFLFLDVSEKTMTTYRRALKQLFTFLYSNNISKPTFDDILLFKKTLPLLVVSSLGVSRKVSSRTLPSV